MPWTGASFKKKHNQSLSKGESERAARVANDILRRTGDEGRAIASANAVVNSVRSVGTPGHRTRRPRYA